MLNRGQVKQYNGNDDGFLNAQMSDNSDTFDCAKYNRCTRSIMSCNKDCPDYSPPKHKNERNDNLDW